MTSAAARHSNWGGLVWTLVRTDFKARYHGTIGGFMWALLKPVVMVLVLLVVFSYIFPSDPVYKRNLVLGLFLWDFFAEGTKVGIIALHQKGFLVTKARFPNWIVVATSASNPLITLAVFTSTYLLFLVVAGQAPSLPMLGLYFGYLLALVSIVAGIALGGSVLFLRYRDLNQVWDVIVQAGFFVAPILYPLDILPERFRFYLYLWPPTPIIQFSRDVLVRQHAPTLEAHLMLAALTVTTFAAGVLLYRRCVRRAVEHI